MGMTSRHLSGREFPTSLAVHSDAYQGPMGGGTSLQKGYRSSADRATAFQTHTLNEGKPLSLSSQTRQSTFNWDAGSSNPGFPTAN